MKKALKNELFYQLEQVIAASPGNIFWKDAEGKFLGCNDNVARTLKLKSSQEIVGKSDEEVLGKEFADNVRATNLLVLEKHQEITHEETGFDEEGNKAIYLTQKKPMFSSDGKIAGLIGMSINITARKKAEEALQAALRKLEAADKIKTDLLSIINAELRAPLNDIIGAIDLLDHSKLDSKQKNCAHIAKQASHSITPVLNYIQSYLNFESGNAVFNKEELMPKTVIEDIVRKLSPDVYAKGLDLLFHFQGAMPPVIITDSIRFCQILTTLLNNAIKYTDSGNITMTVEVPEPKDLKNQKEQQIKISVQDTGTGLTEERQKYLFELFDAALLVPDEAEKVHRWAGLRLSVCKKLLKLQGGDMGVSSSTGKGATFWFTMAFTLPDPKTRRIIATTSIQHYEPLNVLIVDDHHGRAEVIKDYFTYQQMQAVSGDEALTALKKSAQNNTVLDAILIDQRLSSLQPLELVKAIEKNPHFDHTAIILLAYPDREAEFQAGLSHHRRVVKLMKPFYLSSFLSEVTRLYHASKWVSPRILLVEDHLISQFVLKGLLEELGCMVDAVTHGHQALQKMHPSSQYDLVLMDINLPDISGIDVTREIKSLPQYKNLPIVAVTAHVSEADVDRMIEAGAINVIPKPVDIDMLKKILIHCVEGYSVS